MKSSEFGEVQSILYGDSEQRVFLVTYNALDTIRPCFFDEIVGVPENELINLAKIARNQFYSSLGRIEQISYSICPPKNTNIKLWIKELSLEKKAILATLFVTFYTQETLEKLDDHPKHYRAYLAIDVFIRKFTGNINKNLELLRLETISWITKNPIFP